MEDRDVWARQVEVSQTVREHTSADLSSTHLSVQQKKIVLTLAQLYQLCLLLKLLPSRENLKEDGGKLLRLAAKVRSRAGFWIWVGIER